MSTKDLHPGLGSGALREALGELLGKFERHATYRLISQDETELTGNFRWLPTEKLFIEDVRYQEMLTLLSPSSLIEPQAKTPVDEPKNDEREYGCYTCRKQGLKKGQRVSLVYCNECDAKHIEEVRRAARAPQASSEIREALEHTAKLFHRYCAYVSHTSPHAGVTFEDCLEVECVENRRVLALSLSSPIEPERCPTCTSSVRNIKAGLAYGVLEPGKCPNIWHDEAQASSEIRERENPLLLLPDSEWSSLSSDSQRKIQKWFEIATEHLEEMLRPTSEASVREAVEKLPRYIFAPETDARCRRIPTGSWLMREDVLALLTPSRQGAGGTKS